MVHKTPPSKYSPPVTRKCSPIPLIVLIFAVLVALLWHLLHVLLFKYNLRPNFFLVRDPPISMMNATDTKTWMK